MKLKILFITIILLSFVSSANLFSGWSGSLRSFDTQTLTEQDSIEFYGPYFSFEVSPNDSLIAIVPAPESEKIQVFEYIRRHDYKLKPIFEANISGADAMVFSADNKYLAVPKNDTLYICHINTGKVDFIKLGLTISKFSAANDSCCVFTCNDSIIRIFNFNTQKISEITTLPCSWFKITKDLSNIIYTDNETFSSKNLSNGTTNWTYRNLPTDLNSFSYLVSPDGKYLASYDSNIVIYTLPDLKKIYEKKIKCSIVFSRDSKYLTYYNSPVGCKNIRLEDTLETEFKGINEYIGTILQYSNSGKYIIYCNNDSIFIYNLKNETYEKIINETGYHYVTMSDDDKYLCLINTDYPNVKFKIYSLETDKFISDFYFDHSAYDLREIIGFSKDDKYIHIIGLNKIYKLEFLKGVIQDSISIPNNLFVISSFIKERLLFCYSHDDIFTLYDFISGKSLEFKDHGRTVKRYIISTDKMQLLVEYSDKTRILYSIPDSINSDTKNIIIWKIYGLPTWLSLSHNDKYIASQYRYYMFAFDLGYNIWETETGRHLYRFDEGILTFSNIGFSSDDSKVFSSISSDDSTGFYVAVSEHDIISGKTINTRMPYMNPECSFCVSYFSPSGNYFIRKELVPADPNDIKEQQTFDKNNSEIIISPNPASDYIEISYPPSEKRGPGGVSTMIYDVLGMEQPTSPQSLSMLGKGVVRLDVSSLPPGVYFVCVGDKVSKFIKI